MNQQIRQEINSIVNKLKVSPHSQKIILFGSTATGRATDESDIDLLIIKATNLPYHERVTEVRRTLKTKWPLDLIVMTPEEFAKAQTERRLFIRQILKEGTVLYDTQQS